MALTADNIKDLNNMNVAAQRAQLGTTLAAASGGDVAPATPTTAGVVKQCATQTNSTATDVAGLVSDFNALLAKLKTAGIMA